MRLLPVVIALLALMVHSGAAAKPAEASGAPPGHRDTVAVVAPGAPIPPMDPALLAVFPAGRFLHTTIYDPVGDRVLVYGGRVAEPGVFTSEVISIPLSDPLAWTVLIFGSGPGARECSSAIYDPVRDRMIVFAGSNPQRQNDVWTLNLLGSPVWTQLSVSGTVPSRRNLHSAIYDPVRDRMIVFGGFDDSNYLNEVWALTLSGTPTWTRLTPAGTPPIARREHTAIYDPVRDRMIVHGGLPGIYNDTWALSLGASPAWTQLATSGPAPGRFGHVAVYDPAGDRMVIFGGENQIYRNDSFELTLSGTPTWRDLAPGGELPSRRLYPGAAFDEARRRMVVFGGLSDNPAFRGDMWELGLAPPERWAVLQGSTGPPPDPPPVPTFVTISLPPLTLRLGESFTFSAGVRNDGSFSDNGRISFGFPSFTQSSDAQWVSSTSSGDSPGYREIPAGGALTGVDCLPLTASYLAVEYVDDSWQASSETNTLNATVTPQEVGLFYVDMRATMLISTTPCLMASSVPSLTQGTIATDQQGQTVRRFAVNVVAPPTTPLPIFMSPVSMSASTVVIGQPLTISVAVRNDGLPSDDGRIVVSYPGLTNPLDAALATGPAGADTPGYREFASGSVLMSSECQPVQASYLMTEYVDDNWVGDGFENNGGDFVVRPPRAGTFVIEVRSIMHTIGGGSCAFIGALPPNGASGADQQGWAVRRFTVNVIDQPEPAIVSIALTPGPINLGQTITLTALVRDNGAGSDDGRIVVSFPTLTDPLDHLLVVSGSVGDTPGYREFPAGAMVSNPSCSAIPASYLVVEYADSDWQPFGIEVNTFVCTIEPRSAGTFDVDLRVTSHVRGSGCASVTIPDAAGAPATDQQGFPVQRYQVTVIGPPPPPGPPTLTWQRIAPEGLGPIGRAAQAADYDAARDQLVLYSGRVGGEYAGDIWALPLTPGTSWVNVAPGGPVPLRRLMHSMVYNPVDDQLLIFGGYYDSFLNDLWVLARTPLNWWFPINPPGPRPSARLGHAAVYDAAHGRMLVIGGYDGSLRNDVWEFSSGTWHLLLPTGTPMPPRANHSAIYDPLRDRIVVFGGDGGVFLNDVWELRLSGTPEWRPVPTTGTSPSVRREHTAVYYALWDMMVVFGGYGGTRLEDVWTLPLSGTPEWSQRYTAGVSPVPRNQHSAIYDPLRTRMVVFGGQLSSTASSNEVWAMTVDTPAPTPVALALAGAEATPDAVHLTWRGEGATTVAAQVERRTTGTDWIALGPATIEGPDRLVYEDRDVVPGTRYGYRLVVREPEGERTLEPVWVEVPARAMLSLAGASPNPVADELAVAFTLPGSASGAIEVFDLRGRLVASRDISALGAGAQRVALAEGRHLAAGLYLVRLTHDGRVLNAKACVVR
ncbi:MAG TPA: kelch repeat-containing protein [Candidatus Eisenbacteria bacterium]|nr:kelch repeat-containing protein [Candidatus Eisenbacteria bacterium]